MIDLSAPQLKSCNSSDSDTGKNAKSQRENSKAKPGFVCVKWMLYSNHPETIINYSIANLNKYKHSIRNGHLACWRMRDTASVYIIPIKKIQQWINNKSKLKEIPSRGSCMTYKIFNRLQALRYSSCTYLQARLKVFVQSTRITHNEHKLHLSVVNYKIYLLTVEPDGGYWRWMVVQCLNKHEVIHHIKDVNKSISPGWCK